MGPWDLWISLGNFIDFRGGRNTPHRHSHFETCLVLQGEGDFHHGREVYSLKRGDVFTADPGIIHEIVSSGTDHLTIQFVSFSFQKTDNVKCNESSRLYDQYISSYLTSHAAVVSDCAILESQFTLLSSVSGIEDYGEWFLRSERIAGNLILNIMLRSIDKEVEESIPSVMDSRLLLALRFMNDNCYRRLSVDEIAGQACTSARTLRRLVKHHFDKTVIQKCLEIRIGESARYLVAHPEESVAQVGYRFGFTNPSDFGRKFKQIMKISPGEFRENRGTVFIEPRWFS